MTNEERRTMRAELLKMLLEVERFDVQDIRNKYSVRTEGEEREVSLALFDAMESARNNHSIDFGPVHRCPGHYARKEWDQTLGRARRRRARGTRTEKRALVMLDLAARRAPDERREAVEKEADRQRLRIALSKRRTNLPGLDD